MYGPTTRPEVPGGRTSGGRHGQRPNCLTQGIDQLADEGGECITEGQRYGESSNVEPIGG
jgi:hypothetical protein